MLIKEIWPAVNSGFEMKLNPLLMVKDDEINLFEERIKCSLTYGIIKKVAVGVHQKVKKTTYFIFVVQDKKRI